MNGTMLTIRAAGEIETKQFTGPPDLDTVKAAIGGGDLELVPGWVSIDINGITHRCVALCDEHGKNNNLPVNERATVRWHRAMLANGGPGLIQPGGELADVLCGDVVVLFGDAEFMEAL